MKIKSVTGISGYTLLVYRSTDLLYRFSIINLSGKALNFQGLFLTAREAKTEGLAIVRIASKFHNHSRWIVLIFWQWAKEKKDCQVLIEMLQN